MNTIFFMATLLLPLSTLAGDNATTAPERLVGQWAGSPDSCGSDTDDLTLRIARNHITYWESNGPIKAVVVRGDTEIALMGEGET